ncbi:LOW QUALITY PROTEIN: uncharacterized protein zgc:193505 [Danio aesculapii]|uniref:LOW QUALITY PROTEIN: uncharacterized protein zgc:193505 n=1 Tax=Danio aesculapii TaxID=1142201 RepID=UPI0024C0C65D|nr:LOW QUALITY PROTEIN: uncharacterized protein zgc:193505 [Danio aesculapii]
MHLLRQNTDTHHHHQQQRTPTPPTTEDFVNMSFLSGMLGNKGADSFVDHAVDKAASAAKKKVKETITGKKQPADKTGGMGGLFPSSGDNKPKEKSGGLFGGLVSTEKPAENPPAAATSAGDSNPKSQTADPEFNDALDELANF